MFKRAKWILAGIIAVSLGITACGNKENLDNVSSKHISSDEPFIESDLQMSSTVNTIIELPDKEGNLGNISIKQKKITIYTIDAENDKVVAKNSMVTDNGELKPETVIDLVLLELDDLIDDVSVNITEKSDSITVDLAVEDKSYPFGEKNRISEVKVLDCISYSIFDNFTDYKKIYFKLNGEAYKSKQLKLSEKKPFMADE